MINELSSQLMTLIISDPNIADQNPSTSNPEMTPEASFSIQALITKVKKPRLKILIGSVKISAIGLRNAF